MATLQEMQQDFHNTISENPMPYRIQYYTETFSGADYDNAFRTRSGADVWGVANYQPAGPSNEQRQEQGAETDAITRFFLHGSVFIDENTKVGLGSPIGVGSIYGVTKGGAKDWRYGNGIVYRDCKLKVMNAGSFYNEY